MSEASKSTQPAQATASGAGAMEGIATQPAPIRFTQASGYAMEGHGTFWPALDTATRRVLVTTMMGRVKAANLGAGRLASAAEELGLEGADQGEAIRVLAGYEAFAQVTIDWASGLWIHSDVASLPEVKKARQAMEKSESAPALEDDVDMKKRTWKVLWGCPKMDGQASEGGNQAVARSDRRALRSNEGDMENSGGMQHIRKASPRRAGHSRPEEAEEGEEEGGQGQK